MSLVSSGPALLQQATYPEVFNRMISTGHNGWETNKTAATRIVPEAKNLCYLSTNVKRDYSFAGQISLLHKKPSKVDPLLPGSPNAYLLTAASAIPVADAIRGFYQAQGLVCPPMSYVKTPHPHVADYLRGKDTAEEYHRVDEFEQATEYFANQVSRLSAELSGMDHVCIVDEYVIAGSNAAYAGMVGVAASSGEVSVIRGRWYQQAETVDLDRISSPHAEFMNFVGRTAAEINIL